MVNQNWRKSFGEGKVVYLMPEHTADKFACEEYIRLIRNRRNCIPDYLVPAALLPVGYVFYNSFDGITEGEAH